MGRDTALGRNKVNVVGKERKDGGFGILTSFARET